MQSRYWRIASLVYHTGSEIKRNNDKKMKQTDEHSKAKSGLSPRRQSRCKVPAVFGGKDLWKRSVLRVKKEGSVDRRSDGDQMKWHE